MTGPARDRGARVARRGVVAGAGASAGAFLVVLGGIGPPVGPAVIGAFLLIVPAAAVVRFLPTGSVEIRAAVAAGTGLATVVLVAEILLLSGLFSGGAVVAVVGLLAVAALAVPT